MQSLFQDLRYGLRMLVKEPVFTLVAILTLALGIGANAAIFSLINALLLQPLGGVANAERLAIVYTSDYSSSRYGTSSYPDYLDLRERNEVFSELAAFADSQPMHISTEGEAERVSGAAVTGNYFAALGVRAALGRTLTAEDDLDSAAAAPSAVISYDLWRRRFNSAPDIVGQTLRINGFPFTVVGVAAEDFKGTSLRTALSVWVPLARYMALSAPSPAASPLAQRGSRRFFLIGRLRPQVTFAEAQANIATIAAQLAAAYPETNLGTLARPREPRPMEVVAINQAMTGPETRDLTRRFSFMLMAVVVSVLLIGCANVANLLLARGSRRRREIAVRAALGAGRSRIIRQMLTESLLLSIAGGVLGLLLALWLMDLLLSFEALAAFVALDLGLDWRLLGFTLAVSLVTGILFGLAPAVGAARSDLVASLKDIPQAGGIERRFGLRNLLVTAQIALSLALLVGAGLFLRSLERAYSIDFGFSARDALLASVDMARQGYKEAQARELYRQILERAAALPGVEAAALGQYIPVDASGSRTTVTVEGYTRAPGEDLEFNLNIVDENYFRSLGVPLLAGREFGAGDTATSPRVAIINEAMARRFWPNDEAVGKRFSLSGGREPFYEVVGVVRTGKYRNLREAPIPYMYLPLSQNYRPRMTIFLRGNAEAIAPALRAAVQQIDRTLPLFDVRTLDEHLGRALAQERTNAWLVGGFALVALGLALVGLFGLLSYSVAQRKYEIGIRLALGAQKGDILRLVIGQGMALVASGAAIGLAGAMALNRLIASFLFEVSPYDPLTFALIVPLFAAIALLASYIPARRAMSVDPLLALRQE